MLMKKYISIIFAAAALLMTSACETLSVDEDVTSAPVIASFSPKQAPAGAEVVVTGEYLNNVTEAYIGDVKVDIIEKVSNARLSIKVAQGVTSGKIALVNPTGRGESSEDFTCTFAVPQITASLLQASAELGEQILITGEHLNSAASVIFRSQGKDVRHEAEIISQSDNELVVEVPYVEDNTAVITMEYYDETGLVETPTAGAPTMQVIKYTPTFNESSFDQTAVGSVVTLTGEHLDNVNRVTFRRIAAGEETEIFDAIFTATADRLTVTVPAADFPDGESEAEMVIYWFDSNESRAFDGMSVYVPLVYYWQNIVTECQSQNEDGMYQSFFSPQNGRVYANEKWATELDPVAMEWQGQQFSAANVFKAGTVTEEEYYSVVPYLFFSVSGGQNLLLNSPANSNGQLKNFAVSAPVSSQNRVPGTNSSSASGTPILAFRCLDPDNATEKALIDKVVAGEIENIDETTFPIDETAMTIAGISFSGASGGIKTDKDESKSWPGIVSPATTEGTHTLELGADGPVFLMAYYDFNGYNSENRTQNIRRIGLLHITKVDWIISNNDYRGTQVTYNCYWQKYNYGESEQQ